MARDLTDMLRNTAGGMARDALKTVGNGRSKSRWNPLPSRKQSPLSGAKGVAAGAGLAALAPLATKGAGRLLKRRLAASGAEKVAKKPAEAVTGATSKIGETVGQGAGDVKEKVSGTGSKAKEAGKRVLPLGGDGDDGDGDKGGDTVAGVGKGRRMPVQQSVDVAVPVETAYNQFTQFEEWPNFMHRVTRVTQEDDCTVSFASKIWGVTKEFQADIETQRPDQRIKWRVSQGITHSGVVTFHELAPRLTRVELNFDVDPGSLIEKFARGNRHVKRAARADLHRFKAFIEMQETETGAWRGVIEDGELVEGHPEDYDQGRDYSDVEDLQPQDQQPEEQDEQEEEQRPAQRSRRRPQSQPSDGGNKSERPRTRSGAGRGKSASAS